MPESVGGSGGGGGGGGVWTEDGNSPLTETGVSSSTYTLDGTYDIVNVLYQIEDVSGSTNQIDLRFNGGSGNNYNYIDASGSNTTQATSVERIISLTANEEFASSFQMGARWGSQIRGGQTPPDSGGFNAVGWTNGTVTSPLDSMTFLGAGNFDISWQVYGRDLDAAGAP